MSKLASNSVLAKHRVMKTINFKLTLLRSGLQHHRQQSTQRKPCWAIQYLNKPVIVLIWNIK